MSEFKEFSDEFKNDVVFLVKWGIFSLIMGCAGGVVGATFVKLIGMVTGFRKAWPYMLYLMPVIGLVIIWLYDVFKESENKGTNTVIDYFVDAKHIDTPLAPLVYVSTILSHSVGASVGKEGAALQIGGSMGEGIAKLLHFDTFDCKMGVMAGMSGVFAAVFGTPIAAAIFPIEVVSVGIMHYSMLVPCLFTAFIGYGISSLFHTPFEAFEVTGIPELSIHSVLLIVLLGVLCGLLAQLFVFMLHGADKIFKKISDNYYIRVVVAAVVYIALTKLLGTDMYMGASPALLEGSFEGEVPMFGFFLKMLFTAIALGGKFKGGEIVPTFCVGASFGAVFGTLLGFSPSLCAACGMVALFVGVTNCPISTLVIALELLTMKAMPFYSIVIAVAYLFSAYSGLYHSQRIMCSKTKADYLAANKNGEGDFLEEPENEKGSDT